MDSPNPVAVEWGRDRVAQLEDRLSYAECDVFGATGTLSRTPPLPWPEDDFVDASTDEDIRQTVRDELTRLLGVPNG